MYSRQFGSGVVCVWDTTHTHQKHQQSIKTKPVIPILSWGLTLSPAKRTTTEIIVRSRQRKHSETTAKTTAETTVKPRQKNHIETTTKNHSETTAKHSETTAKTTNDI